MRNCLLQYFQKLLIVFSILEVPSQKLTELYYMGGGVGRKDPRRKSQLQLSCTISLWRTLDEGERSG